MTEEISHFLQREAFWLLCDKKIGSGMSREVYSSELFPDCVIKIENEAGSFQNVIEANTWWRVKDTPYKKWFAPVVAISPAGGILIQKRTTPALKYPKKLPLFLGDTKTNNYGMFEGNFVCHDYGYDWFIKYGLTNRVKEVLWADTEGETIK